MNSRDWALRQLENKVQQDILINWGVIEAPKTDEDLLHEAFASADEYYRTHCYGCGNPNEKCNCRCPGCGEAKEDCVCKE